MTGAIAERAGNVVIVEDYLVEYRRRFFEMLEAALATRSVRLSVAVGAVPEAHAGRRDAVEPMSFVHEVPTWSIPVAGRRLTSKRLSELTDRADLVVVDQALRHLESYRLLLRQRRGPKVAFWGHGARRVKPATWLERRIEERITRSAHWFFAYTQGGADHVAATGFPPERITVVQNTIDASELAKLRAEVTSAEQAQLRVELRLPARNVCLYVGALEPYKRVDFLLEASSVVASRSPDFALIVAGDGSDRGLVENSLSVFPWLRYVGRASDREKARLGAVSDVLLIPGSIGLVAVDSFALRTPIVTTSWPFHGPEAEYLEDGVNARFSNDSVADFARTVEEVLGARHELDRLKAECAEAAARYPMETMVARFAGGVTAALATPRR